MVARRLLGAYLLSCMDGEWVGGRIVETEAYLADDDLASHSVRGRRNSNASMFAAAGTLYVYPIHAKYCFNIVTEEPGVGAAVLVRALEPIWGVQRMIDRRANSSIARLTSGPAMMCQALAIDRRFDSRHVLTETDLILSPTPLTAQEEIAISPRIGINKSSELPLRFFIRGNRFVSGPKHWHRVV